MRYRTSTPSTTGWPTTSTIPPDDFGDMLGACDITGAGSTYGRAWWVDGNQGNDNLSGQSHSEPFATMAQAFTKIASGDVIYVRGNIREQLTTPAGVFDVSIIGPSPVTRHPDAHTSNG